MSLDETIKEIEDFCLKGMSRDELFRDLLKQIGEHVDKVSRLKENEDRHGHLDEEIVDIMLLTKGLFYLRGISDEQVARGAGHTLNKIKGDKNEYC